MTTTSASAASSVASNPACSSRPAMRSESWTFIWQPKVSIRYLRATSEFSSAPVIALRVLGRAKPTFAFAFRFRPGLSSYQHLTRGRPKAIADRFAAEHARHLLDARRFVQPANRRARPSAVDPFLDCEMRIGVGGDLRQVRDAEHLECRPQRAQLAADDVGDAAANAGIDLVEDQPGRRCARRTIGGVAEAVARCRGERLDRQHDARELAARDDPRQRPELLAGVG